jgi:BarA-like signal transduction histidine kinase
VALADGKMVMLALPASRRVDLEKLKAHWTESTVRAIIQSLRSKAPVEHNGKTFRAFVISNQLVEE